VQINSLPGNDHNGQRRRQSCHFHVKSFDIGEEGGTEWNTECGDTERTGILLYLARDVDGAALTGPWR